MAAAAQFEREVLPLAFLASDIVEAIVEGRQPVELTPARLKRFDPQILSWNQQREALGFDVPG